MITRARPRKPRPSEQPADLRAEREAFVRNFLHKGVELTESLLRENEGLQTQVRSLEEENVRLRGQLSSKSAVRELLGSVKELEAERNSLLNRSDELERAFAENESKQHTLERELNDLASLYVASFQLGSTLSVRRVVRHISELLEQLVGAQAFVVYVVARDGKQLLPIAARGVHAKKVKARSASAGVLGDACLTGVPRILEVIPATAGASEEPIAAIPLIFEGEVVCVIAVHELLPHKQSWAVVDHELFKLLCAQGATALIGANLYYDAEPSPRAALSGVQNHLDGKPSRRPKPKGKAASRRPMRKPQARSRVAVPAKGKKVKQP